MTRQLNACHNRPPMVKNQIVQDGWDTNIATMTRVPLLKTIRYRNTTDCQYSIHTLDPKCAGCRWNQNKEEAL